MNKTEELKKKLLDEIDLKLINWHIINYQDDEWDEDGIIIDFIGERLQQCTAEVSRESHISFAKHCAYSLDISIMGFLPDKDYKEIFDLWFKKREEQ